VQVLLVTGSPSDLRPANAAVATNAGCVGCGSFAYAWQYVLLTSAPVHLSASAQQRVAQLRQEIADVAGSIEPSDKLSDPCFEPEDPTIVCPTRDDRLDAALDELTAELKSTIDSGVQEAGVSATGAIVRSVHRS
jgi:hypothetical protein